MVRPEADLFHQLVRKRFRDRCREVLRDPLEHRVFWMRYSMGMPPRDIAATLLRTGIQINGRNPTARRISDLLERSCKQLQNDPEIRDLLRSD